MTTKPKNNLGEVVLYRAEDGKTALDVRLAGETVWLTQTQIAKLFDRDQSVISRHVNNVFKEKELGQKSNMQKMHITKSDKPVVFYSLDMIISVGYRVNSKRGTQFRIWATQTLKEHLTRGYTLNRQRFEQNARELETALQLVRYGILDKKSYAKVPPRVEYALTPFGQKFSDILDRIAKLENEVP